MLSKSIKELSLSLQTIKEKIIISIINDIQKMDASSFKSYYNKRLNQIIDVGFSKEEQLAITTIVINDLEKRFRNNIFIDPIKYASIPSIRKDLVIIMEYIKNSFDSLIIFNDDSMLSKFNDFLNIMDILQCDSSSSMLSLAKSLHKGKQEFLLKVMKRYIIFVY